MRPVLQELFQTFYSYREHWTSAINCVSELDALLALAKFSSSSAMSKPQISLKNQGFLEIKGMKHPYIDLNANDISLPPSMLITGANMGGKSTLLKTTCLNVILAQIGAYVPCESYKGSVIRNIFTRLGAYDNILESKSTFQTEMEETCYILKNIRSGSTLVAIDEMGRGTSTFDGVALASATLKYIKEKALCMFTTHYELAKETDARKMKMEVEVSETTVKFTYKLTEGTSESFAMNVARLARIPDKIITRAI